MKSISSTLACSLVLAVFCGTLHAEVKVTEPWVRATVAQQRATGAFMELTSSDPVRLVEVRSPVAKIVELHQMLIENNVMKMQAVAGLELSPGKAIELKPGGYHVMLVDLVKPLKAGDSVALSLVIEGKDKKRSVVEVTAEVRGISGRPAASSRADDHAQHKH
jgi:copper(I)-binding protein